MLYSNLGTVELFNEEPIGPSSRERFLVMLARQIDAGCFDRVHSVAFGRGSCSVMVTTEMSIDQLKAKGYPFTGLNDVHHSQLPPYQHNEAEVLREGLRY